VLRSVLSRSFLLLSLGWSAAVYAASPPSEELFPNTTKGWISVPNVDALRENFEQTQMGELVADPIMQPFMEDLGKQLEEKLNAAGVKLGITLSDLDGVYGGEVAMGVVRPDARDVNSHALALVVDITGKQEQADALLAKIDRNMTAKGARRANRKVGNTALTYYTLPKKPDEKVPTTAVYAVQGDTLVAADHEAVLVGILGRLPSRTADTLGKVEAFRAVATKVFGNDDPKSAHVRWFVEPLGYVEVARAAGGGKQKRGSDKLAILRKQGFAALQGAGGRVDFRSSDCDVTHHSFVYAPPVKDATAGNKYHRAANMLDFPNTDNLEVQPWVPAGVASYITFNWKLPKAFEHFGSLFDAFTEEGTWEEILAGLEQDPAGPQIDIKGELVSNVAERVTVITDYRLPIDPKSERMVVAVELNSEVADVEKKTSAAVRKLMESEPDARKSEVEGHEVWVVSERTEEAEIPQLDIDGSGFVALEGNAVSEEEGEAVAAVAPVLEKPISWAITVANGHIFVATHVDFLADVLEKKGPDEQLATANDLQAIGKSLTTAGSGSDSFRFFTRTDEAYRPTYELLQKGQMPEAETMLARLLNQLFPPTRRGVVREQEIDGRKLPPFEKVAPYLGPAGAFVQSEEQGWLIKGCLLNKAVPAGEKQPAAVAEQPQE
jgi:hypothetical protein